MRSKPIKYPSIIKTRREYFGGIIFREKPAFVAYVNNAYADSCGIEKAPGAIYCEDVFSSPLDAHIVLTTRCDLYCSGCYNTVRGDTSKDISMDFAKSIIDKLAELNVLSLSFGGGEPTIHPQLFEIAEYAREKNILPNMTTNGLSMTEDFAAKCSIFGSVHFSIHNSGDTAFIFSAISTYRKATGKKPGLNLLLTTETMPHLEDFLNQARKVGVGKVLFLRYKTTAKNSDITDLCLGNDLDDFSAMLKRLKRKNPRLMFLINCAYFEAVAKQGSLGPDMYRKYDNRGCFGGNSYIAIDIEGNFRPCSFWHESLWKYS